MQNLSIADRIRGLAQKPVLALILINIVVGLRTYQDYGFALDEPLFYGYADAIGYAYSPREWFSGDFQLERAFGPSPWDHANRGPAYLLIARIPAHLLQAAGVDQAAAWHLVNFIAFQVAVYFLYSLCLRWMSPTAALGAAALFALQPVLWEHAFINPKDPPFLTFFLVALELGFRMVDRLESSDAGSIPDVAQIVWLPAVVLGLASSVRVLGPLAGALVLLYAALRGDRRWRWMLVYGGLAIVAMIATWPLLWKNPLTEFVHTIGFMASNPTELRVLFYGQLYRADALPLRYLPALFWFTLTEPVWLLAVGGGLVAAVWARRGAIEWRSLLATALWFVIPLSYVLIARPPMYDGFRHFMFILPPAFVLGGIAMEAAFRILRQWSWRGLVIAALVAPGVVAMVKLHPYEYTYFNSFAGGTEKAASEFESDYWLTCYKEAMERFSPARWQSHRLFVRREGYIASMYAAPGIKIIDTSISHEHPDPGDYVLENSRANPALQRLRHQTEHILVGREGAVFCVIEKQTQ